MVAESIVESVRDYLQAVSSQGIPVEYGVVFGSQARGNTHEWSDIDLLVVSSLYDRRRTYEEAAILWEVAAFTDSRIEPIPVGERQFSEDDSSAIIEMARREGIRIDLAATHSHT